MTGKEQAKIFSKELEPIRDELFKIKKTYAPHFKRKSLMDILNGDSKYKEMGEYTGSWLGYTLRPWKDNIITDMIHGVIQEVVRDNHSGDVKRGMIRYDRTNSNYTKAIKYNLNDWDSEALFFVDKQYYKLRIIIQIKFANRWYKYSMYEDKIEYKQIQPPR